MSAERFVIQGKVSAPGFRPWLAAHAARIGISAEFCGASADSLQMRVEGPPALLDAMEMACLLGPIEVWVDRIRRDAA